MKRRGESEESTSEMAKYIRKSAKKKKEKHQFAAKRKYGVAKMS
jgi:hypothetical protein